MAQIAYGVSVQIPNGPQIAQTGTKAAEAYDKVELALEAGGAGAAEVVIEIQPAAATAISLLLVKSPLYGLEITYKLSDGPNDSPTVALDDRSFCSGARSRWPASRPSGSRSRTPSPLATPRKKR